MAVVVWFIDLVEGGRSLKLELRGVGKGLFTLKYEGPPSLLII